MNIENEDKEQRKDLGNQFKEVYHPDKQLKFVTLEELMEKPVYLPPNLASSSKN